MKLTASGLLLLAAALGTLATNPAVQAREASPEEELMAAQRAYIQANNAADIAALDRMTADDWMGISATGVARSKAQFLEDVRRRGPAKIQATTEQLLVRQKAWTVRAYGDAGFVARLTAGDHGAREWVTGVWARRGGVWQRVLSQATAVAQ